MSPRPSKQTNPGLAETPEPAGSSGGIRVLDRMAAIFEVLERYDRPVVLREIAAQTGLNKATVYRILQSLIGLRLVEPGSMPATYQLGIRAFQLGACVQRRLDVRMRALPHLQRLNSESEETTFLCLRDGWMALCIERLEGLHVASLRLKLGGSLPLHIGAASRVLLAALSAADLYAYLTGELQPLTGHTLVDPAALLADTLLTRQRGYALSQEDVTDGVCAIGAPIFAMDGTVVAAVSISGILPRFTGPRQTALIELVRQTARAISSDLGYPSGELMPWETGAR